MIFWPICRLIKDGEDRLNYIEIYKNETKTDFDSNKYHIHHIDGNKENNNIMNLVLLPAKLHKQYHYYLSMINCQQIETRIMSRVAYAEHIYKDLRFIYNLKKFYEILQVCSKWLDYRNHCLAIQYLGEVDIFGINTSEIRHIHTSKNGDRDKCRGRSK